ncbi:MAG: hypothetical protein JNJ70_12935 [Verrucomicrobiales bacterium]|nr:hypothetical protein [Verrucomicrobiales bacterium]
MSFRPLFWKLLWRIFVSDIKDHERCFASLTYLLAQLPSNFRVKPLNASLAKRNREVGPFLPSAPEKVGFKHSLTIGISFGYRKVFQGDRFMFAVELVSEQRANSDCGCKDHAHKVVLALDAP